MYLQSAFRGLHKLHGSPWRLQCPGACEKTRVVCDLLQSTQNRCMYMSIWCVYPVHMVAFTDIHTCTKSSRVWSTHYIIGIPLLWVWVVLSSSKKCVWYPRGSTDVSAWRKTTVGKSTVFKPRDEHNLAADFGTSYFISQHQKSGGFMYPMLLSIYRRIYRLWDLIGLNRKLGLWPWQKIPWRVLRCFEIFISLVFQKSNGFDPAKMPGCSIRGFLGGDKLMDVSCGWCESRLMFLCRKQSACHFFIIFMFILDQLTVFFCFFLMVLNISP